MVQLHGMKRVSTSVIRRETGEKGWRKTGKPQQGTHPLQDQSDRSELFSKEKETRCTPRREDKVTPTGAEQVAQAGEWPEHLQQPSGCQETPRHVVDAVQTRGRSEDRPSLPIFQAPDLKGSPMGWTG